MRLNLDFVDVYTSKKNEYTPKKAKNSLKNTKSQNVN